MCNSKAQFMATQKSARLWQAIRTSNNHVAIRMNKQQTCCYQDKQMSSTLLRHHFIWLACHPLRMFAKGLPCCTTTLLFKHNGLCVKPCDECVKL